MLGTGCRRVFGVGNGLVNGIIQRHVAPHASPALLRWADSYRVRLGVGVVRSPTPRTATRSGIGLKVVSTGLHLPPRVQTSAELAQLVGRSERWIVKRTGVVERRISDENMAVMGAMAGRAALGDGPAPDLVINASLTPIQLIPDSSVFLLEELGLEGIPSFSIHATCMSFLVARHRAGALSAVGACRRILVISSEQGSVCRDFEHPESAVLIGDGAAAAVVEATPVGEQSELLSWGMSTWPKGASLAELRGCGTRCHPNDPATVPADNLFRMRGPRIFRMAVRRVEQMVEHLLDAAGMEADDLDLVVPHQPSGPGVAALPRFGLAPERVVSIVGTTGNCIAASVPMALATAGSDGRLQRGQRVLLLGTGAGLHVAGAIVRW